ncbi:MAG: hypothetical protein R2792_18795 [Saprospiraceae bacterium]
MISNNVVVRTQAEADATRPVAIQNGAAVINGDTLTGVARNVVVISSLEKHGIPA